MYVEIKIYLGKDLIEPADNPYTQQKNMKMDVNYYSKFRLGQMLYYLISEVTIEWLLKTF